MENINDFMPNTPDWNKERLETLRKLFPDLFTGENAPNIEEIRRIIDPAADRTAERFEFNWFGKRNSKRNAFSPANTTLVFDESRSVNPEHSENIIIEGENLEVLKLLSSAYREKIKCIYIDPPYNTGKDFVYSDNYTEERAPYWENTGVTENGVKIDTNSDTDGRYHSNWLNMMFSRLLIARQLLREDGVIFISIDDNEVHHLRKLCDEVFGENNFVAEIVWKKKTGSGSQIDKVFSEHEYVLVYIKDFEVEQKWRVQSEDDGNYANPDNDPRGSWESCAITAPSKNRNANQLYQIDIYYDYKAGFEILINDQVIDIFDFGNHKIVFKKIESGSDNSQTFDIEKNTASFIRRWAYIPKSMKTLFNSNRVYLNNGNLPRYKKFESEYDGKALRSIFFSEFSTQQGSEELRSIFSSDLVEYPKPKELLKTFIKAVTDEGDLILDFFAGSGTTGQAVIELNHEAEDGGNRKFILVQIPELTDVNSEAYKAGYKKISDITIERNKRVVEKIIADKESQTPGLFDGNDGEKNLSGLGFKVFQLQRSNFPRVEFAPDPEKTEAENVELLKEYIKEKESQLTLEYNAKDVITELLIKNGFTLNYKLTRQDEFTANEVFLASDEFRSALICVDNELTDKTVGMFKDKKDHIFITLERSLNTNKRWNLKNFLNEKFRAL